MHQSARIRSEPPAGELGEVHYADTPWIEIWPARRWNWLFLDLRELWSHRELLYFLTWREIRIRYAQTILGAMWAVLQPLLNTLVFTIFFGQLAGIPSDGLPYPIWSYCGLLPWMYFAQSLHMSTNSLVANQNLITKVYFPRILVPMSGVFVPLADMAFGLLLLLGMMVRYSIAPGRALIYAPLFLLLALSLALAVGLWLSALNALYRDVRHTLPFLVQFWMFVSPVVYPASQVPLSKIVWGVELPLRGLYGLNPMVGVIEGFRWSVLGTGLGPSIALWTSVATTLLLLLGGSLYFHRTERTLADTI